MSISYEELAGAAGRARFFRPKRHAAADIFAGTPPVVHFNGEEFELDNISLMGAGCVSRAAARGDVPTLSQHGELRLIQKGRELFRAPARQARAGLWRGALSIGFALENARFDFTALRRENARALALDINRSSAPLRVPQEYKSYCADVLDFVGDRLQRIERYIGPIESELDEQEKIQLARELEEAVDEPWRRLLEQGADLVLESHKDNELRPLLKSYTERVVTPVMIGGENWRRSYVKPAGYPGDYVIMNYFYDSEPRGERLADKFLFALGSVAARPIVTRMHKLGDLIAAYANERRSDAPVDIMSIGSGPARELERVLDRSGPDTRWRATLVDQEPDALDYAHTAANSLPGADRLAVTGLNISFKDMLKPSPISAEFGNQDIVYSAGLVDYLNPLMAARFVKRMYDYVKPGGQLIIGNVNSLRTGMIWQCEYVLDWTLFFRTYDEMEAMAAQTQGAKVSVVSDTLDSIYFLVLDKPAD